MEQTRGHRKVQTGVVVSNKMDKTIVVEIIKRVMHPDYKKYINRKKRYKAHDKDNICKIGDRVRIVECRPLSRDKRWKLREIVEEKA